MWYNQKNKNYRRVNVCIHSVAIVRKGAGVFCFNFRNQKEVFFMFREMRRNQQALSQEACGEVLMRGTSGVLAVEGDGGYPYAVPLSYVYSDGKLFFHCAQAGHKLDAIARNEKVSFCVIDEDKIVPEEYTTYFRSVIVFGRARVLENDAEKRAALRVLAVKYTPDNAEGCEREVEGALSRVGMIELTIDHMSGKEAIEFVRQRKGTS